MSMSHALTIALVLVGLAAWRHTRDARIASRRLQRVLAAEQPIANDSAPVQRRPLSRARLRWTCALAGVAFVFLVPSVIGVVVAIALGFGGPPVVSRLEPRDQRRRRERCERDLPLALDLLAACLSSGSSIARAATTVAVAIEGPLGQQLRDVGLRLDLGGDPGVVWRSLGPGERVRRAGVAVARASETGAASAAVLSAMAHDQRVRSRRRGEAAARRVAVRVAAPLGLCFLPAFVLLAIVPAVLGALAPVVQR